MEHKRFQKKKLPPMAKSYLVVMLICSILRFILKHLLIASIIFALEKIGLYNHGFVIDTAITLVAIYLSRRIFKDLARALNDEPGNETSISTSPNNHKIIEMHNIFHHTAQENSVKGKISEHTNVILTLF